MQGAESAPAVRLLVWWRVAAAGIRSVGQASVGIKLVYPMCPVDRIQGKSYGNKGLRDSAWPP